MKLLAKGVNTWFDLLTTVSYWAMIAIMVWCVFEYIPLQRAITEKFPCCPCPGAYGMSPYDFYMKNMSEFEVIGINLTPSPANVTPTPFKW